MHDRDILNCVGPVTSSISWTCELKSIRNFELCLYKHSDFYGLNFFHTQGMCGIGFFLHV